MSAFDNIVKIIGEICDIPSDEIVGESSLIEDLDLSSMEIMAIIGKIEQVFSVKLKEDQIMSISTVDDLVTVLEA